MELQDQLQALIDRLGGLSPPRSIIGKTTVRARCFAIMPFILNCLDQGHTYKEICRAIAADGLIVPPGTMAQYVFQAREGEKTGQKPAFPVQLSATDRTRTFQPSNPLAKPSTENEVSGNSISGLTTPTVINQSGNSTNDMLANLRKPRLSGSVNIQRSVAKPD